MSDLTFEKALEDIQLSGKIERETIDIANEIARIIGDLTEARINSGLSQRQLAQKCGIKQSAIARMESLQVIPRLDTMIKIARCLDTRICVNSSSDSIVSVGYVIDLRDIMANSNQYTWHSAASKSSIFGFTRKEFAYAAIG